VVRTFPVSTTVSRMGRRDEAEVDHADAPAPPPCS